ncbi:hypothetical protein BDR07DRAFT_393858 [Suillus spraguei]|nr:hypothetical protein BDR07DRAFT_393858 [Suillus spraguei]
MSHNTNGILNDQSSILPPSAANVIMKTATFHLRPSRCIISMAFLVEAPSRVPRVVDEDVCLPSAVHDINDYPEYHDAHYYPRYHRAIFATPEAFCAWLLRYFVSHHCSCSACRLQLTGRMSLQSPWATCLSHSRSLILRALVIATVLSFVDYLFLRRKVFLFTLL